MASIAGADPPRGQKRARDDRDRREPRQFRVHYEDEPRHDRDRDLDRPLHATATTPTASFIAQATVTAAATGYPRARAAIGTATLTGITTGIRTSAIAATAAALRLVIATGAGGIEAEMAETYGTRDKYSAHSERDAHGGSMSKRADPVEAFGTREHDAKRDQGVTAKQGINRGTVEHEGEPPRLCSLRHTRQANQNLQERSRGFLQGARTRSKLGPRCRRRSRSSCRS